MAFQEITPKARWCLMPYSYMSSLVLEAFRKTEEEEEDEGKEEKQQHHKMRLNEKYESISIWYLCKLIYLCIHIDMNYIYMNLCERIQTTIEYIYIYVYIDLLNVVLKCVQVSFCSKIKHLILEFDIRFWFETFVRRNAFQVWIHTRLLN